MTKCFSDFNISFKNENEMINFINNNSLNFINLDFNSFKAYCLKTNKNLDLCEIECLYKFYTCDGGGIEFIQITKFKKTPLKDFLETKNISVEIFIENYFFFLKKNDKKFYENMPISVDYVVDYRDVILFLDK